MHMITWLFSPWGIPANYRAHAGLGRQHLQVGQRGRARRCWSKYHWMPQQGVQNLTQAAGERDPGDELQPRAPQDLCTTPSSAATSRSGSCWCRSWRTASTRSSTSIRWTTRSSGRRSSVPAAAGRPHGAGPQPRELLRRGRAGGVRHGRAGGRPGLLGRQDAAGPHASRTRTRSATASGPNYLQLPINAPKKHVSDEPARRPDDVPRRRRRPGANPHVNYEPISLGGLVRRSRREAARAVRRGTCSAPDDRAHEQLQAGGRALPRLRGVGARRADRQPGRQYVQRTRRSKSAWFRCSPSATKSTAAVSPRGWV